jgi:hypothetical protein
MKAIAFVSLRRILSEFVRTSSYEDTSNLKAIRFTSLSRNSGRKSWANRSGAFRI